MRFLLFALLAGCILVPAGHRPKAAEVTGTSIQFTVRNAGIPLTGTMKCTHASIHFDPASLATSTIEAVADPSTLHTGIAMRDHHLRKADYFNVIKYPTIKLRSLGFISKGKKKFTGRFELTIKDIVREVLVPLYLEKTEAGNTLAGDFEINRLDFQLGEPSSVLEERVRIEIKGLI
jgi:polyisoprenoid-binding protein YceI